MGEDAKAKAKALKDGELLVVENVRYDARETSKDDAERAEFAAELAALTGENGAYVNDAFWCCAPQARFGVRYRQGTARLPGRPGQDRS